MATVEALPEDLRPSGRRIPADTMVFMSQAEAEMRASYLFDLACQAASEPEDKAKRTLQLAEKVAKSLSADAYSAEYGKLSAELADANLRGDSRAAYEAYAAIRQLERDNPPFPAERLVAVATAAVVKVLESKLTIPPPVKSRVFRRKRRS